MRFLEYTESYFRPGGFEQSLMDHYPFWGVMTFFVMTAAFLSIERSKNNSPHKFLREMSLLEWFIYFVTIVIMWPILWAVFGIVLILSLFVGVMLLSHS